MKHLIILVLFLLVAMPMRAQDIAPESTVEAGTVTIVEAPVTPEPWYAKYVAGLLVVFGLITAALVAMNKWLEATKGSVSSMTIAEGGFSRLPGPFKQALVAGLRQFIRLGGNINDILNEIEDDVPFALKPSKPAPATGFTSTMAQPTVKPEATDVYGQAGADTGAAAFPKS